MKIGIITHYYNSTNYGGNLQAYALPIVLQKLGYDAEQISYDMTFIENKPLIKKFQDKTFIEIIKKGFKKIVNIPKNLYQNYNDKKLIKNEKIRIQAFENFNKKIISRGKDVYNFKDIEKCINNYDIFITGSDQVFNVNCYQAPFFLTFVSGDKKRKIAYAASISMSKLSEEQKELFKNNLKDFSAISVREESDVDLIKGLAPVRVINTLDSTLLLDKEDWDNICAERLINEKYLFCYMLGNNKKIRNLANEYAKLHGLKIVNLPHMCGYQKVDANFADYKLWDISPEQFISLIKYSECVFTDSFHAVVFSHIYQKQYFVFNRSSNGYMNSRIYNITKLFKSTKYFCDSKNKETIEYIENLKPITYKEKLYKFENLQKESINFLKNSIGEIK